MLETGKTYHLYNRGNNRENLFYKPDNYFYFLRQFDKYLSNYIDVFAYCLLPNHFHFLIRVKEEDEIDSKDLPSLQDLVSLDRQISTQFRLFFMSYAKAINKQENRIGSLFQKNFKIKEVNNDSYFAQLVFYIHANPQLHHLIDDFKKWQYSSYYSLLSEKNTKLKKYDVVDWFGGFEGYTKFHQIQLDFRNLQALDLED